MNGYVVRIRTCQPEGIGYLCKDGSCNLDVRWAKVFKSLGEAWDCAIPHMGDHHKDYAWAEELEHPFNEQKGNRP